MTTKQQILSYLSGRGWISGNQLENQAKDWQTKASTISRRARELADEGKLDRMIGGDNRTVQYRIVKPAMSAEQANNFLRSLPEQPTQVSFI